jgi:hypothetical protein
VGAGSCLTDRDIAMDQIVSPGPWPRKTWPTIFGPARMVSMSRMCFLLNRNAALAGFNRAQLRYRFDKESFIATYLIAIN